MTREILIGLLVALGACGDAGGGEGTSTGVVGSSSTAAPTTGVGEESSSSEGSSGSGSSSGGGDPFDVEPMCSSGKMWMLGDEGSPHMHPGRACRACHMQMEPEIFARYPIAGTLYATGHEIDDCRGVDGGVVPVVIEITTADARVIKLAVNSSGNFMYDVEEDGGPLMYPITAKVVQGDRQRPMLTPQVTGDCNGCHTEVGTGGAPGRIVLP